jgi:site-specific DNA-methyltransferase (adenine-specific)
VPTLSLKQTVKEHIDLDSPRKGLVDDAERPATLSKTLGGIELNRIYLGSFVDIIRPLPDKCVDLIVADPPYNASKGGAWSWDRNSGLPSFGGNWKKVSEVWDDMSLEDYFAFTIGWLGEAKRVLKPTGSMWVHGTYHNAGIINFAMQLLEIEIINEIVWYKRNSFPNLSGRRITASHETILWAHSGKKRQYKFNYKHSKEGCFDSDRLKMPGKQMRTVWDIPNNKGGDELKYGKHPTQKPERLIRRMIQLSAAPGDICLVPFAGAGSECVSAIKEDLLFLGCEIDPKYHKNACKRIGSIARELL